MRFGWFLFLVACGGPATLTDKGTLPTDTPDTGGTTPSTDDGFCAVRRAFTRSCLLCHDADSAQGGLDLETDPVAATVNVPSATHGVVLVAPGDPQGSLLYRKVSGTVLAGEGAEMPPNGADPAVAAAVEAWIAAGATEACGTSGTTTTAAPYHPPGWDDPREHGMATKLQTETDCRSCHGQDLGGGSAPVACDDCHASGWESNCTFCHGGVESSSGAPPEDIDDNDDPATISFVPHEVHLAGRIMPRYDCDQCHVKPSDALSAGHLFDDPTAGVAEVVIQNGTWGNGSCGTNYCHGDGRGFNGTVAADAGPRTCGSCHADAANVRDLSGEHERHVDDGIRCDECHADAQGNNAIDQPELHVNGARDVAPSGTIQWSAASGRCTGSCHSEGHNNRAW